jgi:hypothetical protein
VSEDLERRLRRIAAAVLDQLGCDAHKWGGVVGESLWELSLAVKPKPKPSRRKVARPGWLDELQEVRRRR